MNEIPNLSRYQRQCVKGRDNDKGLQEILVTKVRGVVKYIIVSESGLSRERNEIATSLIKAKAALWSKTNAKWVHVLICPTCGKPLKYSPTNIGDYRCEKWHAFTRFGEKAIKHSSDYSVQSSSYTFND